MRLFYINRSKATTNQYAILALLLGLLALLPCSGRAALPPIIDAKPLFGDKLVQGRWQPIVVTITNQDTGDALTGEVKTSLVDSRTGEIFSSIIAPVTLPRGAGTVRTTATVFVPENDQPDIMVSLQQGRDERGATITRRSFDKQRFVNSSLTLLAVTTLPDAISYLRGEKLGVENTTGVLRPIPINASPRAQSQNYGQRATAAIAEVRVENLAEAGLLPQTASGYEPSGLFTSGRTLDRVSFPILRYLHFTDGWQVAGFLLSARRISARTSDSEPGCQSPVRPGRQKSGQAKPVWGVGWSPRSRVIWQKPDSADLSRRLFSGAILPRTPARNRLRAISFKAVACATTILRRISGSRWFVRLV